MSSGSRLFERGKICALFRLVRREAVRHDYNGTGDEIILLYTPARDE